MRRLVSKMFPNSKIPFEGVEKLMSLSQSLLYRKRLIQPSHPGAYTINPLIFRALKKLEKLIDDHMEGIGGQRIAMPYLSPSHLWKKTGRWDSMGRELFSLTDRTSAQYCLAPTHEEVVCDLVASQPDLSYKIFPLLLYQIGTKFRDEPHPKHGLLRGREFIMKDMYTFDEDLPSALKTYEAVVNCYDRLFSALGLKVQKVKAHTGNIGGSQSEEFHLESAIGEDTLHTCSVCGTVFNAELIESSEENKCQRTDCKADFKPWKGIELGHAFLLGERYSRPLSVAYKSATGVSRLAQMGCFGLGVTRIIGASLEVLSEPSIMKWPKAIAPYKLVIIPQKKGYRHEEAFLIAEHIYDQLNQVDIFRGELVIDDRTDLSIGERLRHAKLCGYPYSICIGKQALECDPKVELVHIYTDESKLFPVSRIREALAAELG